MNSQFIRVHVRFRLRNNYLYCRIIVNSKRCNADFSINERVEKPQWDSQKQAVKGSNPEATIQNTRIETIRAQIKAFALDLSNKGMPCSADSLKALFIGKTKLAYNLIETSEKHLAYLELLPSDEIAQGTIDTYRYRHANMVGFLKAKRLTGLTCEEFTPAIARQYVQYLRVERAKPMVQNTAVKNLDLVRKVVKFSINQEWTKFNPLQAFVIKKGKHKMPPYLSEEEREALQAKHFSINRLQKIKDCFVFCCHTGLSFKDVKLFRASQHLIAARGLVWVEMQRFKTGIDFYVPLTAIAQDILHRYGGEQLPVPSNTKFNGYLKEIQNLCGISTNLTVRVARTTFGVVMLNDMNQDLETVSKMLGHANTKITEKHYTQVLKKKVVQNLVMNNPLLYAAVTVPTICPSPMTGFRLVRPLTTIALETGE